MIVVDTSALIAIVKQEAQDDACKWALAQSDITLISAGTFAELMIVAEGKKLTSQLQALLQTLDLDVIAVTQATALLCAQVYRNWGKGVHPAGLNFGDCFAYQLAKERNCPLLFVGNDFSQTDIVSAI